MFDECGTEPEISDVQNKSAKTVMLKETQLSINWVTCECQETEPSSGAQILEPVGIFNSW